MTSAARRFAPGDRMAVRTRIDPPPSAGPALTDTVGEVTAVDDEAVTLATRRGAVTLPLHLVVAARVIPPRLGRRGAPHRAITIEDLHRVMTKGNPGLDVAWLGEPGRGWLLRAAGGYTGRADSALPLGDPGLPEDEAVAAVVAWYRGRELVPLLQVPLPTSVDWADDPFASDLLARGWRRLTPTLVMTGRSRDVAERAGAATPGPTIEARGSLTEEWLAIASPAARAHPEVTRRVLSAPREQAFLLARDADGSPVGVARVSLDDGWAGIYGVHVPEHLRRRGTGGALTAAAGRVAADHGASLTYLQVEEPNAGAVALYERAGLRTHHRYAYLRLG